MGNELIGFKDVESNEEHELKVDWVIKNMRLAYAFTKVGCQGRPLGNFATADTPQRGLTVWDTDHYHFHRKHLFTGVSRCRSGALLQVV